jgi:hypothetical protein
MFYTPPSPSAYKPDEFLLSDDHFLFYNQGKILFYLRILSTSDVHFADPLLNFVSSSFQEGVSQLPDNNLDWLNDMTVVDLGATMMYGAFQDSSSDPPGQLDVPDQVPRDAAITLPDPSTLANTVSQTTTHQHDPVVDSILGTPTSTAEEASQVQLHQGLCANSSESMQGNNDAEGVPPSIMMRSSSFPQQTSIPLQTPTVPVQVQNPPLNADGKMFCDYLDCSSTQTWERKCDWQ